MGKVFKIIGVVLILILVPKIIMKVMGPKESGPNSQIDSMVKEINANLPKDLGSGATLTKADFDGRALRYFYTLDTRSGFTIDQKDKYEGNLRNIACGSMKPVLDQGFNVDFQTTYSESGTPKSFDTSIQPSKCL
ncbi:hypothetical protein [Dokdonella soli]|uniref:Uncharacterized protein n=1 Tax=Dokdonella soli TaxID=529810 RepID=A0ABP3U6W1_9GAMM